MEGRGSCVKRGSQAQGEGEMSREGGRRLSSSRVLVSSLAELKPSSMSETSMGLRSEERWDA